MTMKQLSIGARLTIWYTAILAAGLMVFGGATWIAMRHSLRQAVDGELRDRLGSLREFLAESRSREHVLHEFQENSALGPGGELFQVMEANGAWMHRSSSLADADVPVPRQPEGNGTFEEIQIRGRRLRALTRVIEARGEKYTVQIVIPVDEVYESLSIFRWILIALSVPMLALAAIGGAWISRRALRPVADVVREAGSIDANNLSRRLPVVATGDEVQKLTETLNGMLDRLEDSFQHMVRFTGDASHELRTPVALIRAASEVALRKTRTVEEYQDTLREIGAESERVTALIGDLLTLARADAGLELAELESVELEEVATKAVSQMSTLATARGIRLRLETTGRPIRTRGDQTALQRVVCIILDNAIKYTPSAADVVVRVSDHTGAAVIEVQDRGVGISRAEHPLIFERFYRADKARSRDSGGAGLGLSIARSIVDTHHGQIQVSSTPGDGSTFRVVLPAA